MTKEELRTEALFKILSPCLTKEIIIESGKKKEVYNTSYGYKDEKGIKRVICHTAFEDLGQCDRCKMYDSD